MVRLSYSSNHGGLVNTISYRLLAVCVACLGSVVPDTQADAPKKILEHKALPALPSQAGIEGAFVGVSDDAVLVAGGRRSDGSISDAIFILKDADSSWESASAKLESPLADGVAVTHDDGLICIGGSDGRQARADVFKLTLSDGMISRAELPNLPSPSVRGAGAVMRSTLYIASGMSDLTGDVYANAVWQLDLGATATQRVWTTVEGWPGSARHGAIAAVQDGSFFVLGGIGRDSRPLTDGYQFKLSNVYAWSNVWTQIADAPVKSLLGPSPALPLGQTHVAVSGVSASDGDRALYTYHTVTDQWSERGVDTVPGSDASTAWNEGWAIIGPHTVNLTQLVGQEGRFRMLDWLALLAYLVGIMVMGFYFSKREHSTEDYFLGGHRVPWWAAGLSIFGTQLSAMTFMATPAVTYSQDWVRMIAVWMYLPVAYVAIVCFLPFYRRLNITTVYEYLEARFNVAVRLFASAVFIASALIRVAVVVYLPALALGAVTGVDVHVCIVVMGTLCIVYTVLGGMEAVIWTDVVQVVVLIVGALMCLGVCLIDAGGFGNTIQIGMAADKFHIFNWGWDLTEMTVFVMVFGNVMGILQGFSGEQSTVQRYMTTSTEKEAAKSIWTTCILSVVTAPIFYFLGTALFVFYTNNPAELMPGLTDAIVPWFIAQQLPAGIAGIVIGGIFAASMSSLDSAMHSAATAYVTDFHQRFKKGMSDHAGLVLARWATVITGVLGTCLALVLAGVETLPIFDRVSVWTGRLIGGIGGLFFLAVFTTRTTATGAMVGAIVGTIVPYLVSEYTQASFYLYNAIGILSCMATGYIASMILPGKKKDLSGLTMFTVEKKIPGK